MTDADRAVERALRERIAAERPGETVYGEEEGDDGGAVRWIVDPIDGTRNFSRGLPVWATLIALERDGADRVRRRLRSGARSPLVGSTRRGSVARRRAHPRLAVSRRWTTRRSRAVKPAISRSFEPRVWHARGLGDFWQHMLVAEGALDAAVDARLALWDYAAVAIVVEEAGGRTGAPDGGAARPDEQLVSTNGLVHDAVLELLRGRLAPPLRRPGRA